MAFVFVCLFVFVYSFMYVFVYSFVLVREQAFIDPFHQTATSIPDHYTKPDHNRSKKKKKKVDQNLRKINFFSYKRP